MFCSKCGQQCADKAVFCKNCGNLLNPEADEKELPKAVSPAGVPPTPQGEDTITQKNKMAPWIVSLISVVAAVIIGAAIVLIASLL